MNNRPRITRSSNVKNSIALEKSKHCIVRLEDIKRQQRTIGTTNSSTPQQSKAKPRILVPSSAVKKTPLQKILPKAPQSAPPRSNLVKKKSQSSSQDDDLDSVDLSSFGRSRRTPKPNVKYFNDSVVTIKPGKKLKIDDEDEGDDGNSSDADVDFEEEKEENVSDFEISEEEEEAPPAKKTRLAVSQVSKSQTTGSKSTVVNKNQTVKPAAPPQTRQTRTIVPVTKMEVKKPTIVEKPQPTKKPMNIVTYTSANKNAVTRKRPLESTTQKPGQQSSTPQRVLPNRAAVQSSTQRPGPQKVNNVQAIKPKSTMARRSTAAAVPKPGSKKDDDEENDRSAENLEEDIGNSGALNTEDDFEAMPTFTIVNINDIINKKGDVLMQQTFPEGKSEKVEEKQENVSKNRRKATHTVLNEEPSTKSPPPKTPFPPIAPKKTILTSPPAKKTIISAAASKKIVSPPNKPPQRILNSTLCRQQTPVSPIINAQKQQDQQKKEPLQTQQPKQQQIVKKVLSPVKQPINNNTLKTPPQQKRKLPEEKITVQRQGTKTIKKMTCFENWYVVHCPENQPPKPIANQLTLPLIRIANTLQDICLPSEKWTSKVALSLIPDLVFQRGQFEKYVGNYHDKALVKDEIKHRYQPASILFRRAQKPNTIDRTVILKNRTYLIYIQGKAVSLIGAPKIIKDLQDIESLLVCVDHLALDSDDVDITPNAQPV